jgi:hypothetical protein
MEQKSNSILLFLSLQILELEMKGKSLGNGHTGLEPLVPPTALKAFNYVLFA